MENEVLEVSDIVETFDDDGNDITDYKAIALERQELAKKNFGIAKRFQTKLEKAKSAVQEPVTETKTETKEPNEPDYARMAYLDGKGITNPDDQKWVQDEANRLKLPLTNILQMEYAKAKLQSNKEQQEAMDGMPKGRGKGGGQTQNEVDYWVDRVKPDGTYETPEDHDLAIKVINARIAKESKKSQFSDTLYTG
jgi:hypothetical protein